MSQITTLPSWVSRKATKTTGDNLIHIQIKLEDLLADDATVWADGEYVGLCEIPFGSTVLDCRAIITTGSGSSSTANIGVTGFTSYSGTTFSADSTGYDADGLMATLNVNTTTLQVGTGIMLGKKLDENVFTDADELNKPLYVVMTAATLAGTSASIVGYINLLVSTP